MNQLLNEKSALFLKNYNNEKLDNDIRIVIGKSGNENYEIYKNDKLLYTRVIIPGYYSVTGEQDTEIKENFYTQNGVLEVSNLYEDKWSFEKDDVFYRGNTIFSNFHYSDQLIYELKDDYFQASFKKVLYDPKNDKVYFNHYGMHVINLNKNVSTQVDKIMDDIAQTKVKLDQKIKEYTKKILNNKSIFPSDKDINKYLNISEIISKSEYYHPDILWVIRSIENIKKYYTKYMKFQDTKKEIEKEIDELNNMLNNWYDIKEEKNKELKK